VKDIFVLITDQQLVTTDVRLSNGAIIGDLESWCRSLQLLQFHEELDKNEAREYRVVYNDRNEPLFKIFIKQFKSSRVQCGTCYAAAMFCYSLPAKHYAFSYSTNYRTAVVYYRCPTYTWGAVTSLTSFS